MRVLIANDDGLASPGIALMEQAAAALGGEAWIVAPERKWTAASHQLSFDRDLTLTRRRERVYECSGAPADCVVGAMTVLWRDGARPDLVLAGVNDKRNVAEDVAYSGTMAIAREGTLWGVPSIALSCSARWTDRPEEIAAMRRLLFVLWSSHKDWAQDGHWLALTLPAALPARLVPARVGRDKIGGAADVIERDDQRITWRIRRGRPGTCTPGDENAIIAAGDIALVRHGWIADAPPGTRLVERWNEALRDYGAVA
jgi:5'-nucleotidase